jgi:predicted AAA+ superfamily ATPase
MNEPYLALEPLLGLVVLDEVQRVPELFTILRPLADRPHRPAKFLLLGSASPDLVRRVSKSLAGRVGFVDMAGLNLAEIGEDRWRRLWLRGGYPRSYLAANDEASLACRHDLIRTVLERDIPQLSIRIPAETLLRFWTMIAHYHGQVWNGAQVARAVGVSERTVRAYLDVLTGTYVIRVLPPWFENLAKRQVKSPKVYVRDSGLLHALLAITSQDALLSHPKFGASWEGFALEQVLSRTRSRNAAFWATHAGAELDLLLFHEGRPYGVEFKYADAPGMTKSLHSALRDLNLARAWIVYPGPEPYPVHEQIDVVPLAKFLAVWPPIRDQ